MLLLLLAFLALLFLKIFGVISIGWVVVFIPLMVAAVLYAIGARK